MAGVTNSRWIEVPELARPATVRVGGMGTRLGRKVVFAISTMLAAIALFLLFFAVFAPIALWRKIRGFDSMQRIRDPRTASYLVLHEAARSGAEVQFNGVRTAAAATATGDEPPRIRFWLRPFLVLVSLLLRQVKVDVTDRRLAIYTMF